MKYTTTGKKCSALTLGGVKCQNRFLSENGHVAYQIKENDTHNNMQAIILPLQAP